MKPLFHRQFLSCPWSYPFPTLTPCHCIHGSPAPTVPFLLYAILLKIMRQSRAWLMTWRNPIMRYEPRDAFDFWGSKKHIWTALKLRFLSSLGQIMLASTEILKITQNLQHILCMANTASEFNILLEEIDVMLRMLSRNQAALAWIREKVNKHGEYWDHHPGDESKDRCKRFEKGHNPLWVDEVWNTPGKKNLVHKAQKNTECLCITYAAN